MVFTTGTGPSKDKLAQERSVAFPILLAAGALLEDSGSICWWPKERRKRRWTGRRSRGTGSIGIIVEEAGGRSSNVRAERTIYTGNFLVPMEDSR